MSQADATPIGHAWLRQQLGLRAIAPAVESYIVAGARRTEVHNGRTTELYPRAYATDADPLAHLKFALKHEPLDLGVIIAALKSMDASALRAWVLAEPSGAFSRRAWFLYETFSGNTLDVGDAKTGNYVDVLDADRHIVAASRRSRRHRVFDNLLGGAGFCPTVRRTARLTAQMGLRVDDEAKKLIESYDPLLLARAVNYLFTKETKSSFAIEGERPSETRAERFITALRGAPSFDPSDKDALIKLQAHIVEPRYAGKDWRSFQNFIGDAAGGWRQTVHFICPRPADVPSMMDAWAQLANRVVDGGVDAVVAAALVSFAFVFIHPFEDGNGRIHRFLIHHVLAKRAFSPPGCIFPVSAAILRDRKSYDAVLESFAKPLKGLIQWHWDAEEEIVVDNDTGDLYRYFDATPFAEYLYERVAETVHHDLKDELGFVALFDRALVQTRAVLEMPDKKASLFVRLCLENHGRLSKTKRQQFAELSDEEVLSLEAAVQRAVDADA